MRKAKSAKNTRLSRFCWLLLPLVFGLPGAAAAQMTTTAAMRSRPVGDRTQPLSDSAHAIHVLQRATFGVTPRDLAQVLKIGTNAWLDKQLHPEKIDDSALEQ